MIKLYDAQFFRGSSTRSEGAGVSTRPRPTTDLNPIAETAESPTLHAAKRQTERAGTRPFYSAFGCGLPLISIRSTGPPGTSSSNTPTTRRPVYHAKVSRSVRHRFLIGPFSN